MEVADETINANAASVALVGRNAVNYGQAIAENFIKLTQNFASAVQPAVPLLGQMWYDAPNGTIKVYDGTRWSIVGGLASDASSPTTTSGAVGVVLPTTVGKVAVSAILAEGKIVAIISHSAIPRANLPETVTISGVAYEVKPRFAAGLSAGITLADNDYTFDRGIKWGPSRTISLIGDVTGTALIDGSSNKSIAMTLAKSGVEPGTYEKVTVDAKGRVTSGTNPPPRVITLSNDATGSSNDAGQITVTLAATGVNAGSYGSNVAVAALTVDSKGRVTQASSTPIQTASTAQAGIVQLSAATDSDSDATAATASAVKAVADSIDPAIEQALVDAIAINRIGVPLGGIIMWSGAVNAVPVGFALCDGRTVARTDGKGQVTTPNLKDRFIVGAGGAYAVGDTGGANAVTLTAAQIPGHVHKVDLQAASGGGHTHTGTTSSDGAHAHNILAGSGGEKTNVLASGKGVSGMDSKSGYVDFDVIQTAGAHGHSFTTSSAGAHAHGVAGDTESTGGGGSHENRPPYYALAYIMKV